MISAAIKRFEFVCFQLEKSADSMKNIPKAFTEANESDDSSISTSTGGTLTDLESLYSSESLTKGLY